MASIKHAASKVNPESLYRDANRRDLLRPVTIQDTEVREAYAAVTFEERIHREVLDIAMNTILQQNDTGLDQAHFSLLRDWLIGSGASSHLTLHAEDLILNVDKSNAVLEVSRPQ